MHLHVRRLLATFLTVLVLPLTAVAAVTVSATPANADACYTWDRVLRSGSSGSDVRELQIRVAGWAGYDRSFPIDGSFGPKTERAVRNFQSAYGLAVDGVAGSQTYSTIYALQDADCTPAHFDWYEVDDVCFGGWPAPISGSIATVKRNLLRVMWQAEALRHRLGDHPLRVTSAYRSRACNDRVGGATSSNHLYGRAIDLVPGNGNTSMCGIVRAGRYTAFRQLLGPGYPDHDDHIHLANQSSRHWSAPGCGVS